MNKQPRGAAIEHSSHLDFQVGGREFGMEEVADGRGVCHKRRNLIGLDSQNLAHNVARSVPGEFDRSGVGGEGAPHWSAGEESQVP